MTTLSFARIPRRRPARLLIALAMAGAAGFSSPIPAAAPPATAVDAAIAGGKSRFENLCVACHGKDGAGGRAPRLRQRPELAADFIRTRILEGKHDDRAMPPWGTVLDAAAIDQLVAYVGWLSQRRLDEAPALVTPFPLEDEARIAAGRKRFNKTCAGYCHGYDGVGGRAPDFKGRTDLAPQTIFDTIFNGRTGADVMPPWGAALSDQQIWELVAYIRYLGTQSTD